MADGILLVDKPIHYTSHDVVSVIRRKLKIKRVGHAGTLDPMATGVLVILLGQSTRLFQALSGANKKYQGIITLGEETDTLDSEGLLLSKKAVENIGVNDIDSAFSNYLNVTEQVIPKHSSMRIGGRKGYKLARKGIEFRLPSKVVEILRLSLLNFVSPNIYFDCEVSSGTYIRSIARDIGISLGVGGCLTALRRTKSGAFSIERCISLNRIRHCDVNEIFDIAKSNLENYECEFGKRK